MSNSNGNNISNNITSNGAAGNGSGLSLEAKMLFDGNAWKIICGDDNAEHKFTLTFLSSGDVCASSMFTFFAPIHALQDPSAVQRNCQLRFHFEWNEGGPDDAAYQNLVRQLQAASRANKSTWIPEDLVGGLQYFRDRQLAGKNNKDKKKQKLQNRKPGGNNGGRGPGSSGGTSIGAS